MAEHSQGEHSQADDRALLTAMLCGDEEAFIALYRRRQAGLHRFALRMTGSHATAEDAVQETFLVLMRRGANYDPARGTVSAFLYGIARNCVLRGLERSGTLLAVGLGVGNDEMERRIEEMAAGRDGSCHATLTAVDARANRPEHPIEAIARAEEVETLRCAILALPEHYRSVVVLCDLEELSYEEAAAALGCAVGTVRSRLHRARASLGHRLRRLTTERAKGSKVKAPEADSKTAKPIPALRCEA